MAFRLFPKLPREIRLMIWEFALPGPRIVPLIQWGTEPLKEEWNRVDPDDVDPEDLLDSLDENGEYINYYYLWGFKSDVPAPSIIFVNREAYDTASKYYTKAFPCLAPDPTIKKYDDGHTTIPEIWFDYENDILFLDHYTSFINTGSIYDHLDDFVIDELEKVKNLAITVDHEYIRDPDGLEHWVAEIVGTFSKLKNLYLVLERVGMEGHSEKWRDYTSAQKCDLVFLDALIDVDQAMKIYNNVGPGDLEIETINEHCIAEFFDVDLEELERILRNGYLDWEMPNIERNILMTGKFMAKLIEKRRNYHYTIRGNRESHGLPLDAESYLSNGF